jgi:hypothetical protein
VETISPPVVTLPEVYIYKGKNYVRKNKILTGESSVEFFSSRVLAVGDEGIVARSDTLSVLTSLGPYLDSRSFHAAKHVPFEKVFDPAAGYFEPLSDVLPLGCVASVVSGEIILTGCKFGSLSLFFRSAVPLRPIESRANVLSLAEKSSVCYEDGSRAKIELHYVNSMPGDSAIRYSHDCSPLQHFFGRTGSLIVYCKSEGNTLDVSILVDKASVTVRKTCVAANQFISSGGSEIAVSTSESLNAQVCSLFCKMSISGGVLVSVVVAVIVLIILLKIL